MINKIISGIIKLIVGLVTVILTPIDNLITSALPDLSTALNSISGFLNLCTQSIGWVISLLGLPPTAISLIVMFYGFSLTAPMLFYMIKLAIAWYDKLKL